MNKTQQDILKYLSDNKFISGAEIGEKLGISRNAISKNIKILKEKYSISILATTKSGYKLDEKIDLLDTTVLEQNIGDLEYFYSIGSTSSYAMQNSFKFTNNCVIVSESQSNGFGRFNRAWHSPFGKNIYCTMLEHIDIDVAKLSGLSLVVSIAIADVLKDMEQDPKLKWPNDIYLDNKKLAGVIINISAEMNDKAKLFIGFGLNVNMQSSSEIATQWTSIKEQTSAHIDRTELLIKIIKTIRKYITLFVKNGFSFFIDAYERYNYLADKVFVMNFKDKNINNCKYIGLTDFGEIIINSNTKHHTFSAGEISISASSIKES